MLRPFTAILIFLFTTTLALAQQGADVPETPAKDRIDYERVIHKYLEEESTTGLRYRNQHNNLGALSKDQVQYRLDLQLRFEILKDGKLVLRARALTGTSYDGSWNETGLSRNETDPNWALPLRHFYLDYSPTEKWTFQGGAMPNVPAGIKGKGAFSLDGDGWVDGGRVSYKKLASWADQITVTVGRVSDYKTPDFYRRDWDSPNFVQVHVQGLVTKRIRYVGEVTQFEDDKFIRGVIEVAVKDVVSFVDAIVIEDLVRLGEDAQQGFAFAVKKALGNWKTSAQYSFKAPYASATGPKRMPLEDFYRQGHQISFTIERPFNWGTPYVSFGKTVGTTKGFSPQGLRAETGIKVNLSPKKWKKKK